jgi:5-methyltetrahydropteroyltriglutamate--homocysteine methyltransferase
MLTTTIGAYPKPEAVPIRDWFQMDGGPETPEPTAGYAQTVRQYGERLQEILDRATVHAVREQVELGIDIPTDGEIRRENFVHYHCRHLLGIDFETLSERQMRGRYEALLPTIAGPIRAGPPFLVRDWEVAQSATRQPVKITVPGPLTIGDSVADNYYRDARLRGAALADALNVEIRRLADAGCPVVQVDEPAFAGQVDNALAFGAEHLERCFHKVPPSTERVVHICCGYPDALDAEDYPRRRTTPTARSRTCWTSLRLMRCRSRTHTGRAIWSCSSASPARR